MSPKKKAETFVAVDGTALAYRSHFAFINRPLTTRDGQVTSAVFGFILAFRRIQEELAPDALVVVFDPPGPTFRHQMYDQYKAQRERMPSDLRSQFPFIERYLDAAGVPHVAVEGFEADDVLGTLGLRAGAAGMDSKIVSNDKDLLQIVNDDVTIVQLGRQSEPPKVMDAAGVEAAFGVAPGQIIDFLALTGDSSDNVPGVPGVGKKTAAKLLVEYGSLDALLAAAQDLKKSKMKENLLAHQEDVQFSRELVTLRTDVDVAAPDTFRVSGPDEAALNELFEELDFQSLKRDVDTTQPSDDAHWTTAGDAKAVAALAKALRKSDGFALHVELEGENPHRDAVLGLAVSEAPGHAAWIPLAMNQGENVALDVAAAELGPLLGNESLPKWGLETKRSRLALKRLGLPLRGVAFDATLASYVLDPSRKTHGLADLARERLSIRVQDPADVRGAGRAKVALADADPAAVGRLANEAADVAYRLRASLEPDLDVIDRGKVFGRIEMPLVRVLAEIEETGVAVDVDFLGELSARMEKELASLQEEAWKEAGQEFNLGSPKQVGELLFGTLGLKPRGRTKTGHSTNADVLAELAKEHAVPGLILRHREVAKLKSTYVDALPALVHPDTGRIHTRFQQAVAATGRLSSADPNLQNVPIRTWEGREIRKAFVPGEPGWEIVSCDYSQIELRLLAHMAQDTPLLEAFREDRDIHRATAALVFGIDEDEVTAEQRGQAKTVNFAVIYGMGAVNLGRSLGISTREASRWIENYFDQYPGVSEFIHRTQEDARVELVVETLAGRRRPVPEIASPDHRTRAFGERIAVNTPIQGTAADIMKLGMIAVRDEMRARELRARMLLTVHDELVFEAPSEEVEELVALVTGGMSGAMELSVPLKVDSGHGANWAEAH